MRPAKITFPGEHQEKLENIARVSLKIADKGIPPISSKKRRKSSKNDSSHEEICQKQCATKYSPLKDNEDNEKVVAKSKKSVKLAIKTEAQKKALKRIGTVDDAIVNKRIRMSHCRNKREKKTEEINVSLEHNELDITEHEKTGDITETEINSCMQLSMQDNSSSEIITQTSASNSADCDLSKLHVNFIDSKILLLKKMRILKNVNF